MDYVISFMTTHEIPLDGKIKLEIPSDIRIDIASLYSHCFHKINSTGIKNSALCLGFLNATTSKYEITVFSIAFLRSLSANSTVNLYL